MARKRDYRSNVTDESLKRLHGIGERFQEAFIQRLMLILTGTTARTINQR